MKILLVDGQGGKLGKAIAEAIIKRFQNVELIVVGTNGFATAAMIKGGAVKAATGENAVVVNSKNADIIVGPIGIAIADSLLGEITPLMALAIAQSNAVKILIPSDRCKNIVVGVGKLSISEMIEDTILRIEQVIDGKFNF